MTTIRRLVAILIALFLMGGGCLADTLKSKVLQKEYKKVCKELKSNGWKVYGKQRTLDEALKEHFQVLEEGGDSLLPITGHGKGKSVNIAVRKATTHAAVQYASMKGSTVESIFGSEIATTQVGDDVETKTVFDAASRTTVNQNIKALTPNLTVYRTLEDGTVEMQSFFLVKHVLD